MPLPKPKPKESFASFARRCDADKEFQKLYDQEDKITRWYLLMELFYNATTKA